MFAQSNILPQVSQITFTPQQSAMPPQDIFQTQLAGQAMIDAPLRREMQREQIGQMRQQQAMNREAMNIRQDMWQMQKQNFAAQQAEMLQNRIEDSAKVYNELTGLSFSNPLMGEALESVLGEYGVTPDTLTGVLDASSPIALKEHTDKIRKALYDPRVQKLVRLEAGYENLLNDFQKNPDKYEAAALGELINEFETNNSMEYFDGLHMSNLHPSKFYKQEDPFENFFEEMSAWANRPGAYRSKSVRDAAFERASALGMDLEEFDQFFELVFGLGIIEDEVRELVRMKNYGSDVSDEDINREAEFLFNSYQFVHNKSGRAAAMDLFTKDLANTTQQVGRIRVNQRAEEDKLSRQLEVEAAKQRGSQQVGVQIGSVRRSLRTGDGKLDAFALDIANKRHQETIEHVTGYSITPSSIRGKQPKGEVTIADEWVTMTPGEAENRLFEFIRDSKSNLDLSGGDARHFVTNVKRNPFNSVPITEEDALGFYNESTTDVISVLGLDGNTYDITKNGATIEVDGESVFKPYIYLEDSRTGRLLSDDPALYEDNFVMLLISPPKLLYLDNGDVVELRSVPITNSMTLSNIQESLILLGDAVAAKESANAGGYDAYNIQDGPNSVAGIGENDPRISSMTIEDIQSLGAGAYGKYQMRQPTIKEGVSYLGYSPSTVFTTEVQEDIFHNYIMTGNKRPQVANYIRGASDATLSDAVKALRKEFVSLSVEDAEDILNNYRRVYEGKLELVDEKLSTTPIIPKNPSDVIGYSGNTGYSTGPHIDLRVKKNGAWVNPKEYASMFNVGNRSLSDYEPTDGYRTKPEGNRRQHSGIDYRVAPGRAITITNPSDVEGVYITKDSGGIRPTPEAGKSTSGGIYTMVELKDGTEVYLMHLHPDTVLAEEDLREAPVAPTVNQTEQERQLRPALQNIDW